MKLITLKTLLLSMSIIGLIACSKDNNNPNIAPDVIVGISGTDAGALLMKNYKLDVARTDSFTVNISSTDLQTKDLSLTLDMSQTGLDLQNTKRKAAGEANYTVLPKDSLCYFSQSSYHKNGYSHGKICRKSECSCCD
jgi:hypothetical protein